jgi:branched-chain amino acid transport system substrate-binding protein
MKHHLAWPALGAALVLAAAGCGGDDTSSSSSADSGGGGGDKACTASIGVIAPVTGDAAVQGTEQLHFAELAVQQFNEKNGTKFKVVQGDTQLDPGQASTVGQQFISNKDILGIAGPAGSAEVEAMGPLLERAKLAAVSASATSGDLTTGGKYPTFFRVVPPDTVQGPTDADYISGTLGAKKVFIVDDQTSYSTGIADSVAEGLKSADVAVQRESINQKSTDFSSLVSKIAPDTDVVFLPWQIAANAQLFGQQMKEQGKDATIFGSDGVFSAADFKIDGSYVSSFAPDIRAIPDDKAIVDAFKAKYGDFGTFGAPTYAAATVVANAINEVCKAGGDVTREAVTEQVRNTNMPTSILGQPIKFTPQGDLEGAKFFIFRMKGKNFELVGT